MNVAADDQAACGADAADPEAAAGIDKEGTNEDEGPTVHDSPALTEILGSLDPERPVRVLDLGPALPTNLEFYSRISTGVRIVPLLRDDGLEGLRGLDDEALTRWWAPDGSRLLPNSAVGTPSHQRYRQFVA